MTTQLTGRFLSHCEDTPYFMTDRHATVEEATGATIKWVANRLQQNGCGDGLVYDREERKIIAVFGATETIQMNAGGTVHKVGIIPMPDEITRARMATLALLWDQALETKDYPDSVWPSHSDFC